MTLLSLMPFSLEAELSMDFSFCFNHDMRPALQRRLFCPLCIGLMFFSDLFAHFNGT